MLYYLLYHVLQKYFSPFNVFRYITVRTVYASLTAMFLALVFGPWLIRRLRELQIGQYIREEGPQAHQKKAGTPTMGGVLIVLSTAIPSLLWADLTNPFILIALFALAGLVIVGSSIAVNLTDGLDGLAIGCTVIAAGALTVLTYVSSNFRWAAYLDIQYIPKVGELTVFCGALVGASLGFLWYNAHPAEIFMGDVGSLSLGGTLGTIAVIIKQEILLFFVGGIFVVEALSVILQVFSFKLRGKRIFRMAPIHHHFELLGWSESKVIVRFWIAALVFALFALTTLKLR